MSGAQHSADPKPLTRQALASKDPRSREKQTFTATRDSWTLLLFYSNMPRTAAISFVSKVMVYVAHVKEQANVSDHQEHGSGDHLSLEAFKDLL